MFFFFNDTATTEIYTLSLHDALPIFHDGAFAYEMDDGAVVRVRVTVDREARRATVDFTGTSPQLDTNFNAPLSITRARSEEHTSELQSRQYLVCRLLLEKKNEHTL